jgi:hypothetical protein
MGGVNNTDLRKRGFFAYVISSQELPEEIRAIRRADRRVQGIAQNLDFGNLRLTLSANFAGCRGPSKNIGRRRLASRCDLPSQH